MLLIDSIFIYAPLIELPFWSDFRSNWLKKEVFIGCDKTCRYMLNMPRIKPITEESGFEKTRLVLLSETVKSAGKGFFCLFWTCFS